MPELASGACNPWSDSAEGASDWETCCSEIQCPSPCTPDGEETARSSSVAQDGAEMCLICFDPVVSTNALEEAGFGPLQVQQHAELENSCKGRVFQKTCHECLLQWINSWDSNISNQGDCPCPICRQPLRKTPPEKIMLRAWLAFKGGSEKFRADCHAFLDSLADSDNLPARAAAKAQLHSLARCKRERMSMFRLSLHEEGRPMENQPWYNEAMMVYQDELLTFRRVREQYKKVWPVRSTKRRREASERFMQIS